MSQAVCSSDGKFAHVHWAFVVQGLALDALQKPTLHLGPHIDGFPGLNSASRDSYGEDQLPGRGGRSATNGEGDLIPRSLQQSDRQAAQDSAAGLAESPDTLLFGQPEEMADGTRMFQAASSDNLRQLDKLMSEQPQTLPRQRERSNAREQTGPGKVGRRKGPRRSALLPRLEGPPELAGATQHLQKHVSRSGTDTADTSAIQ